MRIPPLLRLLRPALAPTAAADLFAGALFVSGVFAPILLPAALGSMAIYMGGMALNDLCDRKRDAALFPHRPLVADPSLVGPARLLAAGLFATGLLLHALSGVLLPGLLVAALAAAYDFGAKRRFPLDAITLGATRAANLCVGIWLVGGRLDTGSLTYALSYLCYIGGVTGASRAEDLSRPGARRFALSLSILPMLLALGGIASLVAASGRSAALLLPLVVVAASLVRALREGSRAAMMRHVFACLATIYLFHGAALWLTGHVAGLLPVAGCALATLLLLRLPARGPA